MHHSFHSICSWITVPLHHFRAALTNWKVLPTPNIKFSPCFGDQSQSFRWRKPAVFLLPSITSRILAEWRKGKHRSVSSRLRIVRIATRWSNSGFFFNSAAIIEGSFFTSRSKTYSVRVVTFFLPQETGLRRRAVHVRSEVTSYLSLKCVMRLPFKSVAIHSLLWLPDPLGQGRRSSPKSSRPHCVDMARSGKPLK